MAEIDPSTETPAAPITAYIALGSNLGHREKNLYLALARLRTTLGVRLGRISSFLENPAVGGPDASPPFLNAVTEVQTTLTATELLSELLHTETELGRVRREKWEPRIIDLDLILYGDQIIHTNRLIVPHPLMHERRFVLQPLAAIAPDVVHPVSQTTIATLLQNLLRLEGRGG